MLGTCCKYCSLTDKLPCPWIGIAIEFIVTTMMILSTLWMWSETPTLLQYNRCCCVVTCWLTWPWSEVLHFHLLGFLFSLFVHFKTGTSKNPTDSDIPRRLQFLIQKHWRDGVFCEWRKTGFELRSQVVLLWNIPSDVRPLKSSPTARVQLPSSGLHPQLPGSYCEMV